MMRTSAIVSCLGVVLVATACQQPGPDPELAKRVQTLEATVEALQTRANDQKLKSQIAGGLLFRSPLEDFFASPEFWENTYDSG
jgi:hypothetical protein